MTSEMDNNTYAVRDLPVFFTAINITTYQLSDLTFLTDKEFIAQFSTLPPRLCELNLSTNDLYERDLSILTEAFSWVSSALKSLNLSYNCLGDSSFKNKLFPLLGLIKPTVTHLNLSGNYLGLSITDEQQATLFSFLPPLLKMLNLSTNDFNQTPAEILAKGFAAFPPGLEILDLSANNLGEKTKEELKILFSPLVSKNLTISLLDNFFSQEQEELIKELFNESESILLFTRDTELTLSAVLL